MNANFKHLNLTDPPFFGGVMPLYKESDPPEMKPQDTPFFNSKQFKLWEINELEEYNKLVDVLIKWRDRGWCEFTETSEWVPAKENWTSWIKYYALLQIPAEEMPEHLYEMNILRMPVAAASS
jgi:hypothetical protein